MAESRVVEGKNLLKEGDKLLKGGWFSKGQPSEAVKKYEEAAKKFRGVIPATETSTHLLVYTLDKVGEMNDQLGTFTFAGKAWEEAARKLTEKSKDPARAVEFYKKASAAHREATNYDKAARVMLQAAEISGDDAVELARESCEILIDEERMTTSRDHFQKAINIMMKAGAYEDTISLVLKQVEKMLPLVNNMPQTVYQAMLTVIALHLYLKRREQAHGAMEQFCGQSPFGSSDHAVFAGKLSQAFTTCNEELLESLRPDFGIYLVGEPARLHKKMNFHDLEPLDATYFVEAGDVKEEQNVELDEDDAPLLM